MMKSTKKGSITVEAAIILPLFIIAVLTISYTVKLIEAEENVINGVADEARYIAAYAYIERTGIGVKSRIEKRVREDKAAEAFSVKRLGYLYSDFHNTGLISIDAAYTVRNRMPVKMRGDFHRKTGILFRGFVGRDNKGQIFSFDMMQTADDGTTVWVFPVQESDITMKTVHISECILYRQYLQMRSEGTIHPVNCAGLRNMATGI